MHLSALGKTGLLELAYLNLQNAHYAAREIGKIPGMSLAFSGPFFHEFVVETKAEPGKVNAWLLENQIIGGLDLARFYPELDHHLLFCVTETKCKADIDRLVARLGELQ
jgi:glycine dehydrogenase subunit 1